MAESKRYYWLKLKRDFFKRHDIQIIEAMPNGKDYILFYLKLLCESVDHDGSLRFNDQIPYSPEMLATITNTNIDVVNSAIQIFTGLHMMELMDDGTYFMAEVSKMLGSAVDNDNANRVRRYREKQKELGSVTQALQNVTVDVTKCNESKSNSKSNSKILRESKERENPRFTPPTRSQVRAFCQKRKNGVNPDRFFDYYSARGWKDIQDWEAALRAWETNGIDKKDSQPAPSYDLDGIMRSAMDFDPTKTNRGEV